MVCVPVDVADDVSTTGSPLQLVADGVAEAVRVKGISVTVTGEEVALPGPHEVVTVYEPAADAVID